MHKKKIRFIRTNELEKQNILDKELGAKINADFVVLDSRIDELNRSKFESNCEKNLRNY